MKTLSKSSKSNKSRLTKSKKSRPQVTIKKAYLTWVNPETHNLIGYLRALQLHLTTKNGVKCGIVNKDTGKLVSIRSAIRMGLAESYMLKVVE